MYTNDFNNSQIKIAHNNQVNLVTDFNVHLTDLFRFPVEDQNFLLRFKGKKFVWDLAHYQSFSQFALENSELVEKNSAKLDINWDWIDEERHKLKKQLKLLLGHEADSEYLKPIISFTLDCFDNYLSYNALHPNSSNNPWRHTQAIFFQKGYLFLATDKEEIVKEYLGNKYRQSQNSKFSFITGSDPKNKKNNRFRKVEVNNFCEIELKILDYLQTEAKGFENAKSEQTIQHFLVEKSNMNVSANQVKNIIKYLKQNGYIGSEGFRGYFVIVSENDLIKTYQHHAQQVQDLERTMKIYEKKAKTMGIHQFFEKMQRI